MKFVDFEDIYINNEGGKDYWIICNDPPQKYIDEAKEIDGENYNENCFGLIVTYGSIDGSEEDWYIDSNAPFYVDNDGNWNYLDYSLSEEEKETAFQMCKDERELEILKEELTNIINESESDELTDARRTWLDERYLDVQERIGVLEKQKTVDGGNPVIKRRGR